MAPQTRPVSKACRTCRTRRIKCDEARPVCQRCIRSGRPCAYATDFDLVHRDETRRTQRRFAQSGRQTHDQNSSNSEAAGALSPPSSSSSSLSPPSRGQPLQTQSLASAVASSASSANKTTTANLPSNDVDIAYNGTFMSPSQNGADVARLIVAVVVKDSSSYTSGSTTIFVGGEEVDENSAAIAASGSRAPMLKYRQRALASFISSGAGSHPNRLVSDHAGTDGVDPATPHPSSGLSMHIGEVAICYFASNFILLPRPPTSIAFFGYLAPILLTQAKDSSLMFALRACSFAVLGNRWVSDTVDLNAIAISQYTVALAKTATALQDPYHSTTDATLATVMLLGVFENITAKREMVAWRSHIAGAIHIVRQREQRYGSRPRTYVERLLLNSVRMQMIAHILSADIPPPVDVDLWDNDTELDSMYLRSQRFQLETSKLRQEFNRQISVCYARRPEDLAAMRTMVLRIQAIANEMANWLASMPQKYRFYTVGIAGEAENGDYSAVDAFPGRIDVYPDMVVAITWNNCRGCRLMLTSLILRAVAFIRAPADYRTTPEYASSVRVCSGLISDIIYSVPFFLGSKQSSLIHKQEAQSTYYRMPTTHSGFECGDDHSMAGSPKSLAGMLLIWSLACITAHDFTTKAQRAFISGRFKYIVNTLGLRYAQVYATSPFRFPSMLIYRDSMTVASMPSVGQPHGRILPDISSLKPPK